MAASGVKQALFFHPPSEWLMLEEESSPSLGQRAAVFDLKRTYESNLLPETRNDDFKTQFKKKKKRFIAALLSEIIVHFVDFEGTKRRVMSTLFLFFKVRIHTKNLQTSQMDSILWKDVFNTFDVSD